MTASIAYADWRTPRNPLEHKFLRQMQQHIRYGNPKHGSLAQNSIKRCRKTANLLQHKSTKPTILSLVILHKMTWFLSCFRVSMHKVFTWLLQKKKEELLHNLSRQTYLCIMLSSIKADARNREKHPGAQSTQPNTCSAAFWNQWAIAYSNFWYHTITPTKKAQFPRWLHISRLKGSDYFG